MKYNSASPLSHLSTHSSLFSTPTTQNYLKVSQDLLLQCNKHLLLLLDFVLPLYFFLRFYLFLEGKAGRKRGREINVWLPLIHLLLGTWPTTQACTLTGNPTSDPLVSQRALNPLSHTSQGCMYLKCWHHWEPSAGHFALLTLHRLPRHHPMPPASFTLLMLMFSVSVSYCCYNKLLQIWWLKTTHLFS